MIVGPLPPPIGGVETVTQAILESGAFAAFDVHHCDTTKGRAKSTQGRFDLGNVVWAARHFIRLQRSLASFHPDVVYIPIAGTWSGVLRDLALGWIAKHSGAKVIGHQHDGDIERARAPRGPRQKRSCVADSRSSTACWCSVSTGATASLRTEFRCPARSAPPRFVANCSNAAAPPPAAPQRDDRAARRPDRPAQGRV
jgi:hypothetical protein